MMYSRMTELIKTRRIVRRGGSLDDQPDQIRLCTYSLHHYCLRWTTLECRPYTAPSTKEAFREVVHNTGTNITQYQRWRTKTTNSGTMLQNVPIKIQDYSWTPQDPRRTRRGDVSEIHKPSWNGVDRQGRN
jgi:hypothetical protein